MGGRRGSGKAWQGWGGVRWGRTAWAGGTQQPTLSTVGSPVEATPRSCPDDRSKPGTARLGAPSHRLQSGSASADGCWDPAEQSIGTCGWPRPALTGSWRAPFWPRLVETHHWGISATSRSLEVTARRGQGRRRWVWASRSPGGLGGDGAQQGQTGWEHGAESILERNQKWASEGSKGCGAPGVRGRRGAGGRPSRRPPSRAP